MKKTLTINISGIIFHIDEDAYEKLNIYLDTLKTHFTNTQGKDEIIADIEGRIAELLQERITDAKQVITIKDVEEVISLMGDPGQFESEESEEEQHAPGGDEDFRGQKRLYRDPDHKVVGGVAAGLAAYFNVDVLWIRLAFVIFTLIWLSGLMIYAVLWIAMPEARTTAEKLQMKGEKVNISNIEKSIKDEVSHLKDKLNDLTSQAKKTVEKKNTQGENVFEQIIGLFITILKVFVRIILIIIGFTLLLTGIGLALAFLFAIFGWGGPVILDNREAIFMPLTDFFTLLPVSAGGTAILKLGLMLFLGIPLMMLIYNASRMIFGLERIRYVGITALNIWIIGLIITLFFAFRIGRDFRQSATATQELQIVQPAKDTLFMTVNEEFLDELLYDSYDLIRSDEVHLVATEEGDFFEQIEVHIFKARDVDYGLKKITTSRGRTKGAARERAEVVNWQYEQSGDTITLNPYFNFGEHQSWQAQHVSLRINVPVGKHITLDESMEEILEWSRYSPNTLAGNTWIMTEKGLQRPEL
ncbi:MAG: PspC domain-containing protein [Bacteroidota bacterium]